jgi:hypothetical protein
MPIAHINISNPILRSPRVMQVEGMFDLPPSCTSHQSWTIDLPIDDRDWNIGLVAGPSGSGKTTLARELFGHDLVTSFDWPLDRAIVDAFDDSLGIRQITSILSAVGFSSPPGWLRPFRCLSTGEQFRANLARAIARFEVDPAALVVFDEFTSVVDRTSACIASAAVAKAVRLLHGRFIAVGCHDDVEQWLQPDWIYRTDSSQFHWRIVRRRPAIALAIRRCHRRAWDAFRRHHYLSGSIHPSAMCFLGEVDDRPSSICAVIPLPHPKRPGWREHRLVCLPDFQGVGIGNATSEFVASLFAATGRPYRSVTSAPAMIRHRARSPNWRMTRPPSLAHGQTMARFRQTASSKRLTASFEYVGDKNEEEASRFGLRQTQTSRTKTLESVPTGT